MLWFRTTGTTTTKTAAVLLVLLTTTTFHKNNSNDSNIFVTAHDTVLAVHGSGTTNPSQCFWNVMDEFMTRTKQPIKMTYRAVGSTTGQLEFINEPLPAADFGSGDIPLTTEQWQGLQAAGATSLHLPVLVGAVGIFHSVPIAVDSDEDDDDDDAATAMTPPPLNLTACILARIYTGDLTDWSDPDVTALNPNLELQSNGQLPVKVARRVQGSSSTSAFTEYLRQECPDVFSNDEWVGSSPSWPSDTGVLPSCEGSGGMSQCVQDNVGAIAYIDAGHGQKDGLPEARLPRNDPTDTDSFWTSAEAQESGGIAQAEDGILPDDPAADFGNVSLIGRPNAWPMVLLTYIYVRQDLSHMPEPDERGLLVAFLKAIYDEHFVAVCRDEYNFILPSETMRTFGLNAVARLENQPGVNVTEWTFEEETTPIEGQGDRVISVKRKSVKDLERDRLTDAVIAIDGSLEELQTTSSESMQDIATMKEDIATMKEEIASLLKTVNTIQEVLLQEGGIDVSALAAGGSGNDFGDSEETQLKAALVLSCLSFVGMFVLGFLLVCRKPKSSSGDIPTSMA